MGKVTDSLKGTVRVELSGAFPEAVLNACAMNAVELWNLECPDAYTMRVTVYERRLGELESIAEKSACSLKVLTRRGGSGNRRFLRRRMWLLLSAALAGALLLVSSLFIWEIDVRGNSKLTEGQILRALEDCGVSTGSYWPGLSADLVRSEMMTRLPDLAWMTVNVSGSRAVVLVSERQEKPEIYVESDPVDIVAGKTGVVARISVLNGKPLVTPGQAVVQGEVLVTKDMDSITAEPRSVRARADVIADTWYELTAVSPQKQELKAEKMKKRSRFALKLGKRRINFYPGDGKDIDECDKIVYEYNLGIEGVFALPVTVVREELIYRQRQSTDCDLTYQMRERLLSGLTGGIDGEMLSSRVSVSQTGGLNVVTLRAVCRENIAVAAGQD